MLRHSSNLRLQNDGHDEPSSTLRHVRRRRPTIDEYGLCEQKWRHLTRPERCIGYRA